MLEEIKQILQMVLETGTVTMEYALWVIIAFGVYKLVTLASILVVIKYFITRLFEFLRIKKVDAYALKNSVNYVADDKLFTQLLKKLNARKPELQQKKLGDVDLLYSSDINYLIQLVEKDERNK